MPFRSPSHANMPPFSVLLADQHETHHNIARHLGISRRTLQRYISSDSAPRTVMLALWVNSRWGLAATDLHVRNQAAHYYRLSTMLERQIDALRRQIAALEGELSAPDRAANSPVFA